MKGDTFITFRGREDVCVAYDIDFSGPGWGCGVEWWFTDPAMKDLEVTPEEDDAICATVVLAAEEASQWD